MVAAMLLLIYEDEELAYWTFVSLIQNLLPKDWFTPSLQGSMTEQAVLADLVLEFLPKTDAHFAELGLELSAVTFGWMLSLFTSCLPIEVSLWVGSRGCPRRQAHRSVFIVFIRLFCGSGTASWWKAKM